MLIRVERFFRLDKQFGSERVSLFMGKQFEADGEIMRQNKNRMPILIDGWASGCLWVGS